MEDEENKSEMKPESGKKSAEEKARRTYYIKEMNEALVALSSASDFMKIPRVSKPVVTSASFNTGATTTVRSSDEDDDFYTQIFEDDSPDMVLKNVAYYLTQQELFGSFTADVSGSGGHYYFLNGDPLNLAVKSANMETHSNAATVKEAWITAFTSELFVRRYHMLRNIVNLMETHGDAVPSTLEPDIHDSDLGISHSDPVNEPLIPDYAKIIWLQRKDIMLHALKCMEISQNGNEVNNDECRKMSCIIVKPSIRHCQSCTAEKRCTTSNCYEYKRTLRHWQFCTKKICKLCLSIKLMLAFRDPTFLPQPAGIGLNKSEDAASIVDQVSQMHPHFTPAQLSMMRQKLYLVLHALLCYDRGKEPCSTGKKCGVPYCGFMVLVLRHSRMCVEGILCPVRHCFATKITLEHWSTCETEKCDICTPLSTLLRLRQEYSASIPEDNEFVLMHKLFKSSIDVEDVLRGSQSTFPKTPTSMTGSQDTIAKVPANNEGGVLPTSSFVDQSAEEGASVIDIPRLFIAESEIQDYPRHHGFRTSVKKV